MRGVTLALVAVVLGAAVAAVFLVRRPGPERQASAERHNVVLITIDTLRADRVGKGFTPALDALAARGARFDNARTTVPLTLPAHVTLMTGLLPPQHGVRQNGVVFRPQAPTLARALRDAGYQTGAFVGAYVLDRRFGLADGFATYDDRVPRDPDLGAQLEAERPGSAVADAAIAWIASVPEPFFIWIHFYDPHAPYNPPPDFLAKANGNTYDGEVAYADAQVGRIVDALRRRGVEAQSVVALAGDHGEGLGEHGEQTHGMLAYDSTLRVPLVLVVPGLTPASVSDPVSLTDLPGTLLNIVHVTPPDGMSGRLLLSKTPPDRDIYAESEYPRAAGWHPLAVLADKQWKLILSSQPELYDVHEDPGETRNVAPAKAPLVDAMSKRIRELSRQGAGAGAAVDPEAAERLRALGYVSGSSASISSNAPNPADAIADWTTFERALALVNGGRAGEALPPLKTLAAKYPASPVFQMTYGRALKESGDARAALAVYRDAVARAPADASLFHDLAVAARAAGDTAEALKAEQAALALDGDNAAALNGLGLLHVDQGRAVDAAAAFERAANADPSNASYWTNLGNARRELGDTTGAERAYRRALEASATHADALNGVGVLLVQQGRSADAVAWFEQALRAAPDFHEARLNLGIAYQESGQREKAAATYRQLLATRGHGGARERQAAADLLRQLQ